MKKTPKFLLLLFCLILGLVLRLNNLSQRSLWTDEFFTFFQSTGHGLFQNYLNSLSESERPGIFKAEEIKAFFTNDSSRNIQDVNEGLIREDTHPPLYFWIMHFWMKTTGASVLTVRLFSVLLGILSILIAYKVTAYLFSERIAVFSAIFMSICPFAVRFSQESRSYGLIIFLGLLSWLFILRYEKHRDALSLTGFALANCAGIYSHYFYIFIALAELFYISVAYRNNSRLVNRVYSAFLISAAFILIWMRMVMGHGYNYVLTQWPFGFPGILDKFYNLFIGVSYYFLVVRPDSVKSLYYVVIGLLVFYPLFFMVLKMVRAQYPRSLFFCLCIWFIPLAILLVLDVVQKGVLLKQERFWIFSFIGFIPLAGYSLHYIFSRKKLLLYIILIFILFSSFVSAKTQFGPAPKDISLWINAQAKGKPSVVVTWDVRCVVLGQAYYLDDQIYMMPVSNYRQLQNGLEAFPVRLEKIFIVRHFNRSDALLMDRGPLEINAGWGFRLNKIIKSDDMQVLEYIKYAS